MRHILLAFLAGLLISTLVLVTDPWEYQVITSRTETADIINSGQGWQVVPNQSNPTYLRRHRFHLP